MPSLVVLLICSSAISATGASLDLPDLPSLTPFDSALPPPVEFEGGVFIPFELEQAHTLRLHECEQLQPRYLKIIKTRDQRWKRLITIETARTRAAALRDAKNIQVIDNNWQSWEVGLLVGGSIAGALAIGAVIGAVTVTIYR